MNHNDKIQLLMLVTYWLPILLIILVGILLGNEEY